MSGYGYQGVPAAAGQSEKIYGGTFQPAPPYASAQATQAAYCEPQAAGNKLQTSELGHAINRIGQLAERASRIAILLEATANRILGLQPTDNCAVEKDAEPSSALQSLQLQTTRLLRSLDGIEAQAQRMSSL